MNQGVHTVDLLVAALGTPVEVFAYTACLAHERLEVEDVATAVVKFAGALGVLHGTTAAFPGLNARLQIHGDQGSAVIDNDVSRSFTPPRPRTVPTTARTRTVGETRCTCTEALTLLHLRRGRTPARCRIHTGSSSGTSWQPSGARKT